VTVTEKFYYYNSNNQLAATTTALSCGISIGAAHASDGKSKNINQNSNN